MSPHGLRAAVFSNRPLPTAEMELRPEWLAADAVE